MNAKHTVYVYDTTGTPHAHGPARASLAQATSVAKTLTRRLGWDCAVATEVPPSLPAQDRRPTATQAATSPVWKDATLAAAWEASAGRTVAAAKPVVEEFNPELVGL